MRPAPLVKPRGEHSPTSVQSEPKLPLGEYTQAQLGLLTHSSLQAVRPLAATTPRPAPCGGPQPPSDKEPRSPPVCRLRHSVQDTGGRAGAGVGVMAAGSTTSEYPTHSPLSLAAAPAQLAQHPIPGRERHHVAHAALVTPDGTAALDGCAT